MNESPALKEAREKLEQDKKATMVEPSPETPENSSTPEEVVVHNVDDLQKEIASKAEKIEELTKKLNAADGRRGSELDALRHQVIQMQDQLAAHAAEKQEILEQKAREEEGKFSLENEVFAGIPKETLEDYDENTLKVMAQLANNVAESRLKQLPNMASVEDLERVKSASDYRTYLTAVERLAPGFTDVNGDVEAGIEPKPEWVDFLNQPVNSELSSESWSEMANRIGTPSFAAKAFKAFKNSTEVAEEVVAVDEVEKPSLEGQVAPSKSNASPKTAPSKNKLTVADYEKLQKRAATPGGLTQELRNELNKYRQAHINGTLV